MAHNPIFRLASSPIFSRFFSRDWISLHEVSFRFQNQWFSTKRLTSSSCDDFTVSYLVNSCGLASEAAIKASRKVKLHSLRKSDSVLALFRGYEFSDTQISTLVRRHPHILLADAKKTLAPKLEFWCSIGVSRLDLAKKLTYCPSLLMRSLEKSVIPTYNFLRSLGLSDLNVVAIWKNRPWIFLENLSTNVMPNVEFVKQLGMSQSSVVFLVTYYAELVLRKPEMFSQLVGEVKQMGFDIQKVGFVEAMKALAGKETTWKRNEEAYKRWSWSDQEILDAFRKYPLCMFKPEKKIMKTMDFLVNKMGWQSQTIAKFSHVFSYSLEKRIIPRSLVVKVLMLKGLVKQENLSLATIIMTPENYFLNKFVTANLSQVPQLLNVYQGKVDVLDV